MDTQLRDMDAAGACNPRHRRGEGPSIAKWPVIKPDWDPLVYVVSAILLVSIGLTTDGCNRKPTEPVDQGPALLDVPTLSGTYVYYHDRGDSTHEQGIYRINLADSEPRAELLVTGAVSAAVAPGGRHLAYVRGGLYVMDLRDRTSRLLALQDAILPHWYGDDTLVYEVFIGDIYLVDVQSREPRLLCQGCGRIPDVSRSGRVAFVNGPSIWTMRLNGTDQREIVRFPDPRRDLELRYIQWSPSGETIAVEYGSGSVYLNVALVNPLDSVGSLNDIAIDAWHPSYSSDGQRILYVHRDPGLRRKLNGQIWIMNATDGSEKRQLTTWAMIRE